MKLIKAYYVILSSINGERILKDIEQAARTCYKSEGKIEYEDLCVMAEREEQMNIVYNGAKSARILIPKLIRLHHDAMLEFGGTITVKFVVDRGISHELVRHRVASFAQESTRYCNYGKSEHITFIIPNWLNTIPEMETNKLGEIMDLIPYSKNHNYEDDREVFDSAYDWAKDMLQFQNKYFNKMKNHKWTPQQARSVLPNSLKTEINVSANIREWRHIFKQRTVKEAHPQMREVMCPLLDEFKQKIPILFDDIIY